MIIFESLVFLPTKVEGNTMCTIRLENGYQFDIIRKSKEKVYKVKGFEEEYGRKTYLEDYFQGFLKHPEFKSKQELITFINEIELLEQEEE